MNDAAMASHLRLTMAARMSEQWPHEQHVAGPAVDCHQLSSDILSCLIVTMGARYYTQWTIPGCDIVEMNARG